MTNAERAHRAEIALLAYVGMTGDRDSNDVGTWIADLITDLHHLAYVMAVRVRLGSAVMNYTAENLDGEAGAYTAHAEWKVSAD